MASGESAERLNLRFRTPNEGDEELLHGFDCGDDDLKGFLVEDALRLQAQNVVRTYLVIDDSGGLAGYVALMSDAIVLQTREKTKLQLGSQDHPVVPALKVARVAVATAMQRRGVGHVLPEWVLGSDEASTLR